MCDHIEFLRYPFDDTLRVLGKKGATAVFTELLNGTNRFNTLKQMFPDISPRTLSARLDDLEKVGLVRREATLQTPHMVRYFLTEKGEDTRTLLRYLAGFSLKWYAIGQTAMGDRTLRSAS